MAEGVRRLKPFLKCVSLQVPYKIESPYDPAIPLLSIYSEKMKTLIQKDTCTPIILTW